MLAFESVFEYLDFGFVGLFQKFENFTISKLFVKSAIIYWFIIKLFTLLLFSFPKLISVSIH